MPLSRVRFGSSVLTSPMFAIAIALAGSLAHCASESESALAPVSLLPTVDAGDEAGVIDGEPILPFEAVPPHVYVSKVKSLLTSVAATNEEIAAVTEDPAALKKLIDVWASTPNAQRKLQELFTLAFQQTQITNADFVDLLGSDSSLPGGAAMLANMTESFGRTAVRFVNDGRPFVDLLSTDTVMMTPAVMMIYALLDTRHIDDAGKVTDKWYARTTKTNTWRIQNTTPIPFAESIDPNSPNYMSFYTPADLGTGCPERVYVADANAGRDNSLKLASTLLGTVPMLGPSGGPCDNTKTIPRLLANEDFTDWRPVRIRKAAPGERAPDFWNLPALRGASEIVLEVPRVGFFSTPAFQANWRTNTSNQARVTVNQSLIVALGVSFESEKSTIPLSETGLDTQHADPSTPCYACHKLLDPMRPYFRRNLTLAYHEQLDQKQIATEPSFSFGAVQAKGSTLTDFALAMAQHENVAAAWAQKLCFFADSTNCSDDDPELQRVVAAFKASSFDFRVLLRELLSSPLVTGAAKTKTFADREVLVSISRVDHLCRAYQNRLGIDACNLNNNTRQIVLSIPRDAYGRGAESPVLTSDVSMFFRASIENLCREIAAVVVEGSQSRYTSKNPEPAFADFVRTVMGLPDIDPRAAPALAILKEHYTAALATTATPAIKPVDALRSTFVLACTAPSAVSIGL